MARVLHIDTEMTWRGGENQLRLLLEGLGPSDVECHVAVRPGSAAAERLARLAKLVLTPMRGGFDLKAAWTLAQHCKEHEVDLIDAHTSNAHSLALLTRLFYPRVKVVVHRRVDYAPGDSFVNRKKYLTPKVDLFIAISEAIRGVLTDYGVPASRVRVARSAVSDAPYKNLDRREARAALAAAYGIDPGLPFLGNASALTDQKGHDVLLKALKALKDRGVPFHCFIAGDGALRDPLEKQRIQLGLEHDVTFMGFIQDVARFLAALDVLAMPSNYEGLGTVILDATFAGACVVATKVGGIPEVILPEKTGLLSPVGDAEAFAANLARVCPDAALRQHLNTAAKQHVHREFSVAAMVGGNLDAYREVLR